VSTRCIDTRIGHKVLSYDLLEGEEKREMDAHLEQCAACRDFREQTLGQEGALDDLAWRAWRLGRRQRVEPHLWLMSRLKDLWIPFLVVLLGGIALTVYLARRGPEADAVRIVRLAVTRGATLDSVATPHVDPGPDGLYLRTDRAARAYVYELDAGAMRRLLPPQGGDPPEVGPAETSELRLPPLASHAARVLVVVVPRGAPGGVEDWDAAVFAQLSGERTQSAGWPSGVRPTLRWYP
jgi:hypothetical protein